MNTNNQQNSSEFSDKKEALEFLLKEKSDRATKAEWAKSLGGRPKKKNGNIKNIFIASAVAASIAFMLFFNINNRVNSFDNHLIAANMITQTEFSFGESTRGNNSNETEPEKAFMELINDENFDEARRIYETKETSLSNIDKYNYLLVLVKQNKNNSDHALTLAQELIDSKSEFAADALWISSAINIKKENFEKAKIDLEKLKTHKYKIKEATEILNLLRN